MATKTPAQLFQQQQNYGKAMSGLSGATALFGQGMGMMQQADSINTDAPGSENDPSGKPNYNLGNFAANVNSIKPAGASAGEIGSGALEGASAGSAFGLVGAGVGAVVGGLSSAVFGGARKREQERKQRIAQANLRSAQSLYNSGMIEFNSRQAGMNQYADLNNTDSRMQNLYTYNNA